VFALFVPVALLLLAGFVWVGVCLLVIGRRLLPRRYWFELGILNYGMSTGTTATGLMLLRIIDRDLDSGAAEDYALAAPLSAPFVGGGMITFSLPVLLQQFGGGPVVAGLALGMVVLFVLGAWLAKGDSEA
jgi:ESS family glutamate:Na+ symporter